MHSVRVLVLIGAVCLLVACGGGSPRTTVAPTATLQVDKNAVASGDTATLSWSSSNAISCQAADGWSGSLAPSGSQLTAPITASTVFSITCSGAGGQSSKASVTINLLPTATLSVNPNSVIAGASATL